MGLAIAPFFYMKIKVLGNPITPYGSFNNGQVLTSDKYPVAFLTHMVEEANAGEYMDKEAYQTKVVEVEAVKKPLSSPSSQPDKASGKKTSKKHTKKPK